MSEELTITHERVDDLPVLLAQLERMQVAPLLDTHFPTHGNWQGLSLGQVASGWLTFILSEANHRLSHVEPWAAERLTTLSAGAGTPVRALDFSDDRLAAVLDYLSADGLGQYGPRRALFLLVRLRSRLQRRRDSRCVRYCGVRRIFAKLRRLQPQRRA